MIKIKAFNLSEVLIALTIITVVGVLTISTVTTNFKKASYIAGLKKADQIISDAAGLIMRENGGTLVGAFSDDNEMMTKFAEKLNPLKTCLDTMDIDGCWHDTSNDFKSLYGDNAAINPEDFSGMLLRNNMLMLFELHSKTCGDQRFRADDGTHIGCGYIFVDVNGFEKPNKFGRDIFNIGINIQGSYLSGQDGSWSGALPLNQYHVWCKQSSSGGWSGVGCAGKIINEGGMNY